MTIEKLINRNGEERSPYANGLVNHLPMGQFALYKMTDDLEKVEAYTEYYLNRSNISPVKKEFEKVETIEECLGNRDLYEPCLKLIRERQREEDLESLVSLVLNRYLLGLSSGLFHTTIRLAYAIEGFKLDSGLKEEVERALAYYITAYRKGGLFAKEISRGDALEEMNKLIENPRLKEIRKSNLSRGQKLKTLYSSEELIEEGFIIKASEEDKVKGLLEILIPAFYNSNSIAVLHCITGLQAVVTLKDYFKDYERALDVLTTTAIAHLLTEEDLDISIKDTDLNKDWDEIFALASDSRNVHTLKITYTAEKLDNLFNVPELKYAVNYRVEKER